MRTPKIISFYTKNTPYEKEVKDFEASCKKFHPDYLIEGIDNLGSWEKNHCYKPWFIKEKLLEFKQPVLWIDIDATVLNSLEFFDYIEGDLCLRVNLENSVDTILTGTVYVNYTDKSFFLLDEWIKECDKRLSVANRKEVWDQVCLKDIILDNRVKDLKIICLPKEYCFVFHEPLETLKQEDLRIVHFSAQRVYKHLINAEAELPSFLNNVSESDLKLLRGRKKI